MMPIKSSQPTSLLEATNQRGKLYGAGYAFAAGVIVIALCASAASAMPAALLISLSAIGGVLLVTAFYAARTIQCPRCKLSWLVWSMSTNASSQWLNWLLSATTCPRCGLGAESREREP